MTFSTAMVHLELPSHVESHPVAFDDLPHALAHMLLYGWRRCAQDAWSDELQSVPSTHSLCIL